jgi:arylsulfatase
MSPLPPIAAWTAAATLLASCEPAAKGGAAAAGPRIVEAALQATPIAVAPAPRAEADAAQATAIVLVTLDTLRREHLGCYGYFRDTSPSLDAFAAQSLVFERAFATAASTFPSHLSMLTGLYPHQHGRTSNQQAVHQPFTSGPGCISLARFLGEAGWRTAAFVSSRVLAEDTGIGDGFGTFWCPSPKANPARAETTVDNALAWLDAAGPGAPIFLWVHLWDTHEPNDPPPAYAELFTADERLRAHVAERGIDVEALRRKFTADTSIPKRFFGNVQAEKKKSLAERQEEKLQRKRRQRRPEELDLDLADVLDLWDRYDACVRYIDDQVGRLFEALRAKGLWDGALVAVVADHGQSLGENDSLGHGRITNLNTFVPFLLRVPGGAFPPRRDGRLVSLVDLTPTLVGRLGPEIAGRLRGQFEGADVLAPDFTRPHVLVEEAGFHGTAQAMAEDPARCALLEGRWKYLFSTRGNELYDLEGAGEGVDVLKDHWDDAVRLHAKVEELLKRRPEVQTGAPVSDEKAQQLLEDLKKMGYVGDE